MAQIKIQASSPLDSFLCIYLVFYEHSGRVFDSRQRGRWFEPHRHHCVVSLSEILLSLLSTGSTQEDRHYITEIL